MNATLQCLLHVNDLIVYFIDEFPKDQGTLININKNVPSKGDISRAFYNLVIGVCDSEGNMKRSFGNFNYNFSPEEFKRILGNHNSQF